MLKPKYYGLIKEAQSKSEPPPADFRFSDHATHGLGARLAQRIFERPGRLYACLRALFPVLRIGKFAIVTRYDDVVEILERDDVFEVPFGLEMAEMSGGANFILGMQQGAPYERMKRHMLAAFLPQDIDNIIAPLATKFSEQILKGANGRINAVGDLITRVPTKICEAYYGVPISDEDGVADWLTSISILFFADPFGKAKSRRIALAGSERLRRTVNAAIMDAKAGNASADTVLGRLVRLQAQANGPTDDEIRSILVGMLSGFVPTHTVAASHMLAVMLQRPQALETARTAARARDDEKLWACLIEAMRFMPLNPGPYRYAAKNHRLRSSGRRVRAGTTVLASTQSAMLDPRRIDQPYEFRPDRPPEHYLLFGYGLHRCFGLQIAKAQITRTFRALLRRSGFHASPGNAGQLERVGPIPRKLFVEFDTSEPGSSKPTEQSMITVCLPISRRASVRAVETDLATLGNPASDALKQALDSTGCIHFASIAVVGGEDDETSHLVIEMSADGSEREALAAFAEKAGPFVRPILARACGLKASVPLAPLLYHRRIRMGLGPTKTAGLNFCGAPGLSVKRIRQEQMLEEKVSEALASGGAPQGPQSLPLLNFVKEKILGLPGFEWVSRPEPTPFLEKSESEIDKLKIFLVPWTIATSLTLLAVAFVLTYFGWLRGADDSALITITKVATSTLLSVAFVAAIVGIPVFLIRWQLFRQERQDAAEDLDPEPAIVQSIMERENKCAQNHMTAVSIMKPGLLRQITLRFAFFVVARRAKLFFRPGFLNEIGTIHFARWVLLPSTNKLLFFSNYAGSWESYLEDFVTKGNLGLTGVWSNTQNFPRTNGLFSGGATDGDRFKRWARRQQQPTLFWYSAYPDLTPEQIRVNAAIRDGLARADSESEARAWRSLFASVPRPASSIEDQEVQALAFGGIGKLDESECIAVRFPENPAYARAWLRNFVDDTSGAANRVTFGDCSPQGRATFLAISATGLQKLGVTGATASTRNSFPTALLHGMAAPWRARMLGDQGESAPDNWLWGGPHNAIDAVVLIYAKDDETMNQAHERALQDIAKYHMEPVKIIKTRLTFPRSREFPSAEPFGFADGISQPLIRGTRRWHEKPSEINGVAAGEMLLGYPDNRGFYPPTPMVPAKLDKQCDLPLAPDSLPGRWPRFSKDDTMSPRDLGRNGTYLVVRQLQQHVDQFHAYLEATSRQLAPRYPELKITGDWIAAKLIGRWKDGTSVMRNPEGAPGREIDNDFLFGVDDPQGLKCPFGSHIRRVNPRDSLKPGDKDQLAISNRHRIFRVGRPYAESDGAGKEERGLLFMCINADIERQFEFIQQTWILAPSFHGMWRDSDAIAASSFRSSPYVIPTPHGPVTLPDIPNFVTVRGGGYFFLPSRSALCFLARPR